MTKASTRIGLIISIGAFSAVGFWTLVSAQSPVLTPNVATFEVASIKPNNAELIGPHGLGFRRGGQLNAVNVTLKELVAGAYGGGLPLHLNQVVGGPSWIESDRFDITAKAKEDPPPGADGPPPVLFEMLRNLLGERFRLSVHPETRQLPVYALVIRSKNGKFGPGLRPSNIDCAAVRAGRVSDRRAQVLPSVPDSNQIPPCTIRSLPGQLMGAGMSIKQLATMSLSRFVDRVIVDKTGLSGGFDWDVRFDPQLVDPTATPDGLTVFTAIQEQLGLKLESQRARVSVVVIDRVEKPTQN